MTPTAYRHRQNPDYGVRAVQLTRENLCDVWAWAPATALHAPDHSIEGLSVSTLDGWVDASFGDWIVRTRLDAFQVATTAEFDESYEPYEAEAA